LERTLGFFFAQLVTATTAVAAFRSNGINAACSVAPVVVNGAEGTILALSVDDLIGTLVERLAAVHGGVVIANVSERPRRPAALEASANGLNSTAH